MIRSIAARAVTIFAAAVPVAAAAQAPGWTLRPTQFAVGGLTEDPRYILSGVVGATRLPSGAVVIADRYQQGVRLYSAEGQYIRSAGRDGQGPGEFEHIRGLGPCETGRIVAFDLHWDQIVYDQSLNFIEQRAPDIPGLEQTAYAFSCEPNGYSAATGWGDIVADSKPGYYVAMAPLVLIREGEVVADFGQRLSSERIGQVNPEGDLVGSGPHPFGKATSIALSSTRLFVGDGSEDEVEAYDLQGRRVGSIRWRGRDRQIREEHYRTRESIRLSRADPSRHPSIRRSERSMPRLSAFPSYGELRVDVEGNLWVKDFERPGDTEIEWRVFSESGEALGVVRAPTTWTLLEIGPEYVIVAMRDELDVETVRLFGIEKGR